MSILTLRRRPAATPTPAGAGTGPESLPPSRSRTKAPTSTSTSVSLSPVPHPESYQQRQNPSFQTLPPEIHLLISKNLIYPDALSLKHTSRYFYGLVDTGVRLKVEWLMERRSLHLECPSNQRCDLGSDLRFCRGSVQLLMQRRREHVECESRPGLGCLIYGTRTCPHSKKLKTRLKRWLRVPVTLELRWAVLLLVLIATIPLVTPILLGWAWTAWGAVVVS
ncbi:hypothetical protein QBC35DRAFT_514881 [Podospora australis]|uniref:F-box domain-containing protein n=1 Tax=Podospora australis TaxID=1536484 RepID=A0AAN7AJG7_9PEZI|nr:hypothetical protein QBC35DRAFT_514881 [Podospora australis]